MQKVSGVKVIILSLTLICIMTLLIEESHAYVYGRIGSSPYPADGNITFVAYLSKNGNTDNEVLTEDNWNSGLGTDNGYASEYFFIDWQNFTLDLGAQDGDTLVIQFTGIGAEVGNSGSLTSPIDTDLGFEDLGNSSWGASPNPDIPTNLQASNVEPGIVSLSWAGVKNGTYRVYRCSQASGAGNGASNGRYIRLSKDLTSPSYVDSTAPLTLCWYIIVAEDGGNLGGHCDEVSVDAALPGENLPPPIPAVVFPIAGDSLNGDGLLIWTLVEDPDTLDTVTYTVEIDDDSSFSNPEVIESEIMQGEEPDSTVSIMLKVMNDYTNLWPNTIHYWRVQAVDNHDSASGYTPGDDYFYFIGEPNIFVYPDSITDTLSTGEVSTKSLTIINEGGTDLNFDISLETPQQTKLDSNKEPLTRFTADSSEENDPENAISFKAGSYTGDYIRFFVTDYGEIMSFEYPINTEHLLVGNTYSGYTVAYKIGSYDYVKYAVYRYRSGISYISYNILINGLCP
jgi:hypothetical protein